jgi:hypothetical protein
MREGEDIERFGGGAVSLARAARPNPKAAAPPVTFTRRELDEILRLYSRKVAAGEWRDYAIDHLRDQAVFSIFRRAAEVPMFRVVKQPEQARKQGAFSVVAAGGLIMKRGQDLARVLRVLDKGLSLVGA